MRALNFVTPMKIEVKYGGIAMYDMENGKRMVPNTLINYL